MRYTYMSDGYAAVKNDVCYEDQNEDYCGDAIDKLSAYEDAEEKGLLVRIDESMALAMLAGARAIEQNSCKYFGTTFVYEPFGCSKEITYYEAAKKLRAEAVAALKGEREDGTA